jgi:hypothetical protein
MGKHLEAGPGYDFYSRMIFDKAEPHKNIETRN